MTLTPNDLDRLDAITIPRTGRAWAELTDVDRHALLDEVHAELRESFARTGHVLRRLREAGLR